MKKGQGWGHLGTLLKLLRVFCFFSPKFATEESQMRLSSQYMVLEEFLQKEGWVGKNFVIHEMKPVPHLPVSILASSVLTKSRLRSTDTRIKIQIGRHPAESLALELADWRSIQFVTSSLCGVG